MYTGKNKSASIKIVLYNYALSKHCNNCKKGGVILLTGQESRIKIITQKESTEKMPEIIIRMANPHDLQIIGTVTGVEQDRIVSRKNCFSNSGNRKPDPSSNANAPWKMMRTQTKLPKLADWRDKNNILHDRDPENFVSPKRLKSMNVPSNTISTPSSVSPASNIPVYNTIPIGPEYVIEKLFFLGQIVRRKIKNAEKSKGISTK